MPMPTPRNLPIRRSGTQVRRQPIRRATPRLNLTQIYALVLMALCIGAVISLGSSSLFAARHLEIHGARFTTEDTVRQIVRIDGVPNLFRLRTERVAAELVALPAVESATVDVRLPDTVIVDIVERQPKLVWVIGDRRYVVDADGFIFGQVDSAGNPIEPTYVPPPSPTPSAGTSASPSGVAESPGASESAEPSGSEPDGRVRPPSSEAPLLEAKATPRPTPKPTPTRKPTPKPTPTPIPTATLPPPPSLLPIPTPDPAVSAGPQAVAIPAVVDRRSADQGLAPGDYIDPIDLDAAYRLAGLTPADVGSDAPSLDVVLDDEHGFTLSSGPDGWVAQFGFYTETLRKDTVIPVQVRDLRLLLAQYGENHVAWVYLMADISDVHINTFIRR